MTWNWFHYKLDHLPKSQDTKTTTASILYSFTHWIIKKSSNLETSTYQWWCTREFQLTPASWIICELKWVWMFPIFIWTNPKFWHFRCRAFFFGWYLPCTVCHFVRSKETRSWAFTGPNGPTINFSFFWINFFLYQFCTNFKFVPYMGVILTSNSFSLSRFVQEIKIKRTFIVLFHMKFVFSLKSFYWVIM